MSLDVPRHISTWVLPNSGSRGVETDKKKALYSMSLQPWVEIVYMRTAQSGLLRGNCWQSSSSNETLFILSARAGYKEALDDVRIGFKRGYVTTDEYANTLRAYQQGHDEAKSDLRDEAFAFVLNLIL